MAKIKGIRIYEVGISYYGRTYEEGKKIGWKDGFRAIYCILKYKVVDLNLFSLSSVIRIKNVSFSVIKPEVHLPT